MLVNYIPDLIVGMGKIWKNTVPEMDTEWFLLPPSTRVLVCPGTLRAFFWAQMRRTNHAGQAAVFRSKWSKRQKSQPGPSSDPQGLIKMDLHFS